MPERQAWFLVFAAWVFGAGAGFCLNALLMPPPPQTVVTESVPIGPDPAELQAQCEALRQSDRELLAFAQQKVESLRTTLDGWETELVELREAAADAEARDVDRQARIAALERQVRGAKRDLQQAIAERDALVTELRETVTALDAQVEQTLQAEARASAWKQRSTGNAWRSFLAEAKVRICARGTSKRHERCHEAVEAALDVVRDAFEACVVDELATPTLVELPERNATPPASTVLLEADRAFTGKGWYVQLCDRTLPEAVTETL